MVARKGRSQAALSPIVSGSHMTAWPHSGGVKVTSATSASGTTVKPTANMMKTAGPSPASSAEKSSPQAGQASANLR